MYPQVGQGVEGEGGWGGRRIEKGRELFQESDIYGCELWKGIYIDYSLRDNI